MFSYYVKHICVHTHQKQFRINSIFKFRARKPNSVRLYKNFLLLIINDILGYRCITCNVNMHASGLRDILVDAVFKTIRNSINFATISLRAYESEIRHT